MEDSPLHFKLTDHDPITEEDLKFEPLNEGEDD